MKHPVINFFLNGIVAGLFVVVVLHAVSKALDVLGKIKALMSGGKKSKSKK